MHVPQGTTSCTPLLFPPNNVIQEARIWQAGPCVSFQTMRRGFVSKLAAMRVQCQVHPIPGHGFLRYIDGNSVIWGKLQTSLCVINYKQFYVNYKQFSTCSLIIFTTYVKFKRHVMSGQVTRSGQVTPPPKKFGIVPRPQFLRERCETFRIA